MKENPFQPQNFVSGGGEMPEEERIKDRIDALQKAFEVLLRGGNGAVLARGGDEGFSGDAASLYALPILEGKPRLVKIAWGEFSKNTFTEGAKTPYEVPPGYRKMPFDVCCVQQSDSYFADARLQAEMQENPVQYLAQHSVFIASRGAVDVAKLGDASVGEPRFDHPPQPVEYEEMMRQVRNLIIDTRFTSAEFGEFLKRLPDTPEALGVYVRKFNNLPILNTREMKGASPDAQKAQHVRDMLHALWNMGLAFREQTGVAIGDIGPMRLLLEIKKKFNFAENRF